MPPAAFEYDYPPESEALSARAQASDRLYQDTEVAPVAPPYRERIDANAAYLRVDSQDESRILGVSRSDGTKLQCGYRNGELTQVTESDSRSGETFTWNKEGDKWISHSFGGETVANNVSVSKDGKLNYATTDGATLSVNTDGSTILCKPDGSKVITDCYGVIQKSGGDTVQDARADFTEVMSSQLSPARMERMQQLMNRYESRMSDRAYIRKLAGHDATQVDAEIGKTMTQTYAHLSELVASNPPSQRFDQPTRAKLAENFLFHAAHPTTVDQGYNRTCWIESGQIAGGLVNHSDHMARLLKEVSLTGTYTSLNNGESDPRPRQFKFSNELLSMGAEESNWSIQNHGQQPWRSPVNLIFDRTLPVIGGRPEFSEGNGGYIDRNGTGTRRIMYMVTGDVVHDSFHLIGGSEQRTLMEKGAFINYLPKHMRTKQLVRDGDSWLVVQDDQHGEYKDYAESRITDLRTWAGQRSNVQYSSTFTPKVVAEEGPVIPIQSARQQPNQYHQQGRRRGRR